jgi:4-hydroxythreonine-4-phosphate dehydrogenase
VEFGKESVIYGRASIAYLAKAHELIKNKFADCLVTGPVNKASINMSGIKFSGQTEFLASGSGVKKFLMLLVSPHLKVAVVTRHIPLKKVCSKLNIDNICETIELVHFALRKYFSVKNPRIGVCGLNPHASDNGVIGDEENRLIKPAIKKCKLNSIYGPFPADSLFSKTNFDCFIAMYHDQGLIPVKLSGLSKVVNMTVGLPFVRTSPGHGTAFDISGLNIAEPDSMKEAIKLAVASYNNLNA